MLRRAGCPRNVHATATLLSFPLDYRGLGGGIGHVVAHVIILKLGTQVQSTTKRCNHKMKKTTHLGFVTFRVAIVIVLYVTD